MHCLGLGAWDEAILELESISDVVDLSIEKLIDPTSGGNDMTRTLGILALAMLVGTGIVLAQMKDDGATTPGQNKGQPKFQDGSGISGDSNTAVDSKTVIPPAKTTIEEERMAKEKKDKK